MPVFMVFIFIMLIVAGVIVVPAATAFFKLNEKAQHKQEEQTRIETSEEYREAEEEIERMLNGNQVKKREENE